MQVCGAGEAAGDRQGPVINEFLASNGSRVPLREGDILDGDGDSSDWLELYNPTAAVFDLGGWYLTDNPGKLTKWRLPPSTILAPGAYLLVFASGKDRATDELHTNFKLAAEGGYLALVMPDGRTVAHAYEPRYPPQWRDVSYGLPLEGGSPATPQYFALPTPGQPNTSDPVDIVAAPRFSHEHGSYEEPFLLTLSCDTPGAFIRYTTDGSPPTETGGQTYTAPIDIRTTTCVRAAAFRDGARPSRSETRTFIFPADVGRQPVNPPGFPARWGPDLADYAMDPEIVDGLADGELLLALRSLPALSLVMDVNDLFGADGIYTNWNRHGEDWERPASVELIWPDSREGFQVNCGVRIHGDASRREAKKSFRLQFTSDYGPTELRYPLFGAQAADHFDQLVLRAGFNDGYTYAFAADRAQYVRDEFVRRIQLSLGHPSPHGTFVHLYINGLYWGLYNPVERPESSFAATYFGGDKEDWDALSAGRPVGDSTTAAWNAMLDLVRQGATSNVNYQRLQGNDPNGTRDLQYVDYLDADNYIDYLLVNFFTGNWDWPDDNWCAALNRVASTGWKTFSWDAEHVMGIDSGVTMDVTNFAKGICEPYGGLRGNPEFCLRFADHVYRAFFHHGPLYVDPVSGAWDPAHPERNCPGALYAELADGIEQAMTAESARWGDVKGVSPHRIDEWRSERDWILSTYLPQRYGIVLDQLRRGGLYPALDPPAFQVKGVPQQGGIVPSGSTLAMTAAAGAKIYYTTDGSDPRTPAFLSADGKAVTLVPEDAPKRVLVPSEANGGHLLRNFSGGFEVTCYQAKDAVGSLAAAEAVIADAGLRTSTAREQARVINYRNTGEPGHFDSDRSFPGTTMGADVDNLVVLVTGKVMIPDAGDWTFGVRGGDGFSLTLSRRGRAYPASSSSPPASGDSLAVFSIAESGAYDLRLVFHEQGGDSELELFAAPGSFTAFSTPDFRLVGDVIPFVPPTEDNTVWVANSFVDTAWRLGLGAVGFAQAGAYEALVQIDVGAEMYRVNGTCYIRIPFTLATASFSSLMLKMRYDDGFIAYLNGTEVARRNFLGDPRWDSVADGPGPDGAALTPVTIDISEHVGLLKPGSNLLAIHGLNTPIDSPDFLIWAELVANEWGPGTVSSAAVACTGPVQLPQSTHIKARSLVGATWSALNEAVFAVGPVAESLRISEIMYHPLNTGNPDDPNTEYLELTNIGAASINLNLVRFTNGVDYTFPSFELPAGGYCLVVKDPAAFEARYGSQLPVVGQYAGSLSNAGERLEMVDAAGTIIESFEYNDNWFDLTDGLGFSLTVKDPQTAEVSHLGDKSLWRPSAQAGGSPGSDDRGQVSADGPKFTPTL
jgi:hypothetical protein